VICDVTLLSLIDDSDDSKSCRMLRTWACELISASRYAFCPGLAPPRYSASSWVSVWSRSVVRLASGPLGLVSVALSASGGMIGSAWPAKLRPSLGDDAPSVIGWACTVPRQGASCFASSDGSISSAWVAPIRRSTSGSLGWTGVLVMTCQKHVRSSTSCGSWVHGSAAVVRLPPSVIAVGAIVGSALCVIIVSS
jgi:hypothetical protein